MSAPPYPAQQPGRQQSRRHGDGRRQPHRRQDVEGRPAPAGGPDSGYRGGQQLQGCRVQHHQAAQLVVGHAVLPPAMRRAARMPSGVAALPRPSRLADTLADTAARVSGSRLARGSSRPRAGRRAAASFRLRPQRLISSITPLHRHSTPAMAMHSSTAAPAPLRRPHSRRPWCR